MREIKEVKESLRDLLEDNIIRAEKDAEGSAKDFIGYMIVTLEDLKIDLEQEHPDF